MDPSKKTSCVWHKILLNPTSTTAQDTSDTQKTRCRRCGGTKANCLKNLCPNYFELPIT